MNQSSLATLRGLCAHKWSVIFGGILKRSIRGITGIYGGLDETVQTVFFFKKFCHVDKVKVV